MVVRCGFDDTEDGLQKEESVVAVSDSDFVVAVFASRDSSDEYEYGAGLLKL